MSALQSAQSLADKRWHRRSFDIYACIRGGWQDTGMQVPHALLVTTLRAALAQPGSSLCDYNDTATPAAIHTLYDHAIELCRTRRCLPDTSRTA